MFTPQRKGWPGRSISPGSERTKYSGWVTTSNPRNMSKGKGVVTSEAPPLPLPPLSSLNENGNATATIDGGPETEVWRRFREVGLLDEASLEKRDKEALIEKVTKLEKELFDYQYNMGLLLIEKREWTSKHEEFLQSLAEAEEILKREQTAHLFAMSDMEKREENLKKALDVEKQCVADLEKALHEIREESLRTKLVADEKLTEAQALLSGIDEKSLEVKSKLHSADAQLAEASRKSSEVERKLHEIESRENVINKERASLNAERDLLETTLSKQRENLQDWEKKLQSDQERLAENQRLINQRESWINENDDALKKKQKDLEDIRRTLEMTSSSLREKEADLNIRLKALISREEESEAKMISLDVKKVELSAFEEKLLAREKMEIQNIVNEHISSMDKEKQDFERHKEEMINSLQDEWKKKLVAVEQKEEELHQKEEKIEKRELTLEKKSEKLKEKEKELDTRTKSLKDKDKGIKAAEKELEMEKKKLNSEKDYLTNLKDEVVNKTVAMESQNQDLHKQIEQLKITQDERDEHLHLQSKLKQEIDEYILQKGLLSKELVDLKEERKRFEKEWEILDEKRVEIDRDMQKLNEERTEFIKYKQNEEERLKIERKTMQDQVKMESDTLKLEKETLISCFEHDRSQLFEDVQRQRDNLQHDFELRIQALETSIRNRQEEVELLHEEKQRKFEEERELEFSNIHSLKMRVQSEVEELNLEKQKIEREKKEIILNKKQLEVDQLEIQKDINELNVLSDNLKERREEFIKERECFLVFIEQYRSCKNCGIGISLDCSNLQPLQEIGISRRFLPERMKDKVIVSEQPILDISPTRIGSNSAISWIKKCSSILKFSPSKKTIDFTQNTSQKPLPLSPLGDAEILLEQPFNKVDYSLNAPIELQNVREIQDEPILSIEEERHINRNEVVEQLSSASPPISEGFEPGVSRPGRRKPIKRGRKKGATWKRTAKGVVEEDKTILKDTSEQNNYKPSIGEEKVHCEPGYRQETVDAGKKQVMTYSSLMTSDHGCEPSETHSDSVSIGGGRKRKQIIAPDVETPGTKRYNLRRSKVTGTAAAAKKILNRREEIQGQDSHSAVSISEYDELLQGGENLRDEDLGHAPSNIVVSNVVRLGIESRTRKSMTPEPKKTKLATEIQHDSSIKSTEFIESETDKIREEIEEEIVEMEEYGDAGDTDDANEGMDDGEEYIEDDDIGNRNRSIGKKLWTFFTT